MSWFPTCGHLMLRGFVSALPRLPCHRLGQKRSISALNSRCARVEATGPDEPTSPEQIEAINAVDPFETAGFC